MESKQKAGVYIDGANVFHGCYDAGWGIDYLKLRQFIERKHDIAVISYYSCYGFEKDADGKYVRGPKKEYLPDPGAMRFFNVLRGLGFRVDTKPLKFINGDETKPANKMDGDLMLSAFEEHPQWEKMILVGGDCDFERLVINMVKLGKPVQIFAHKNRLSKELKVLAFNNPFVHFTYLDDIRSYIERTS